MRGRVFRKNAPRPAPGSGAVIAIAAVVAVALFAFAETGRSGGREGARILRESIERAAVTCYALENFYPPDIGYIERHYGVKLDREKYIVRYDALAGNIAPIITVTERKGGGGLPPVGAP